jgi:hypothetical protein
MDGNLGPLEFDPAIEAGSLHSFARRYKDAHAAAGVTRIAMAPHLDRLLTGRDDPLQVAQEWLGGGDGRLTNANRDRLTGNFLLSGLFFDLLPLLDRRMTDARQRLEGPFAPLPDDLCERDRLLLLRSASCVTLNEVLDAWAADIALNPSLAPRSRCPVSRLFGAARRFFSRSDLYKRAGHDPVSLAKTGSNTAIHVCWSMIEAALSFDLAMPAAEWRGVVWRSRKEAITLASGSLGMIVRFLEASHLHPDQDSAVNPTSDQHAFRLDQGADGLRMRLDPQFIQPFSTGNDRLYTGCPAFNVGGMIERYLEWSLEIALHHRLQAEAGTHARLRQASPAHAA